MKTLISRLFSSATYPQATIGGPQLGGTQDNLPSDPNDPSLQDGLRRCLQFVSSINPLHLSSSVQQQLRDIRSAVDKLLDQPQQNLDASVPKVAKAGVPLVVHLENASPGGITEAAVLEVKRQMCTLCERVGVSLTFDAHAPVDRSDMYVVLYRPQDRQNVDLALPHFRSLPNVTMPIGVQEKLDQVHRPFPVLLSMEANTSVVRHHQFLQAMRADHGILSIGFTFYAEDGAFHLPAAEDRAWADFHTAVRKLQLLINQRCAGCVVVGDGECDSDQMLLDNGLVDGHLTDCRQTVFVPDVEMRDVEPQLPVDELSTSHQSSGWSDVGKPRAGNAPSSYNDTTVYNDSVSEAMTHGSLPSTPSGVESSLKGISSRGGKKGGRGQKRRSPVASPMDDGMARQETRRGSRPPPNSNTKEKTKKTR